MQWAEYKLHGSHTRPKQEYLAIWPNAEAEERYVNHIQQGKDANSCVIVSGGLDSTTLVYDMLDKGYTPHMLSFNYGQRHSKELQFARITARNLGLKHDIIDLTGLTSLISNSALTSDHKHAEGNDIIDVPEGHYAEDTMKLTVVPNRNMIMLAIAAGVAVNYKYRTIGFGVHAGDHFVYPDCRPRFVEAMEVAIFQGNEGFHNFDAEHIPYAGRLTHPIYVPFINQTKADIAYRALELEVPLHLTWSCYKGGTNHCGRCGTCVERLEAIDEAFRRTYDNDRGHGLYDEVSDIDHTVYDDTEFWKTAVKK